VSTNDADEPETPVGGTDAASMWFKADNKSTRSANNLVLTVTKLSCLGLEGFDTNRYAETYDKRTKETKKSIVDLHDSTGKWLDPIVLLVESLVWPIVARRSNCSPWFETKELHRFTTSMRKTATRIKQFQDDENREQTYMKYWLDVLLCKVFKDSQRPPRPDWNTLPLFEGWCKLFMARAVANRDVSFIYSIQKGSKLMWPLLGDKKKQAALDKHKLAFTHEDRGALPLDLKEMINEVSVAILQPKETAVTLKFMPSASACLQAPRRIGGALGLTKRFVLPSNSSDSDAAKIGKLRTLNYSLNHWRQTEFSRMEQEAIDRCTSFDSNGLRPGLGLEVQAIPEPGKFRIITKGDGYLYSAIQPTQGLLLDNWKKCPQSTMLIPDLATRVDEIDHLLPEFPFWCSVDYESATDLLKKHATFAVFENLDLPQNDLVWLSLLSGQATYPDGTKIIAIEGQPMGHPLSFPALCVINYAVYLLAIKRWEEESPLEKVGKQYVPRALLGERMKALALVNGDDMLFKCFESFYPIFLAAAKDAGFKISAGKNYLSPDVCMINSQTFIRRRGVMVRKGYLNLRLIRGQSLKGGASEATPVQIGKDLSLMVSQCPWANCAIPAAMLRWKKDWFGPVYRPNWYLPVHLGGFGLDPVYAPEKAAKFTRSQRDIAARFVHDPRLALYRKKGVSLSAIKMAGAMANWRMIPGPYVPREGESTDISDAWMSRFCYASRANHGAQLVEDKVVMAYFKPQNRLKPMSISRIYDYWNAQVFATQIPVCPPIGAIRVLKDIRRGTHYTPKVYVPRPSVQQALCDDLLDTLRKGEIVDEFQSVVLQQIHDLIAKGLHKSTWNFVLDDDSEALLLRAQVSPARSFFA